MHATAEATPSALTEDQQEVRSWLEEAAPALAGVYAGAALLMAQGPRPGRTHFVAHALREILNRLPEAVTGAPEKRVRDSERLEVLCASWEQHGLPATSTGLPASTPGAERTLPDEVFLAVADLVTGYRAGTDHMRAKAGRMLTRLGGGLVPASYLVNGWVVLGKDLHRMAHVSAQPWSAEQAAHTEREVAQRFVGVERMLLTFARRTHRRMDTLDEILARAHRG